ncbi:MAG: translation elongation factor Ts [Helicobacteraceae bacterium]|jgi:elongation factor Ts|nr:translation elongation factor Ts [Helicobacteraceae bacterium]
MSTPANEVDKKLIVQLREKTSAGVLDCKKALVESGGDIALAVEWLRKKGLSKAAKVAAKVAAEGRIALRIGSDLKSGSIVEINCETDFVAKNDNFVAFCDKTISYVHEASFNTIEEMREQGCFSENVNSAIATMGEKIDIRRVAKLSETGGIVNGYLHSNAKVGVLVAVETDCADLGGFVRDIAMHAAAMRPLYLDESAIPAAVIAKEREIAVEQLKKEGKPEAMLEKIVPGKIKKFIQEATLAGQPFVKDDKKSVSQALSDAATQRGCTARLAGFVRFEVGEGIEKKSASFADEVAQQIRR